MARMMAGQVAAAMERAGMQTTVHGDLSVSGRWGQGYVRALRLGDRWALMNGADFNSSSRRAVAKTADQVERFAAPEFQAKRARGLSDAELYHDGAEFFQLEEVA